MTAHGRAWQLAAELGDDDYEPAPPECWCGLQMPWEYSTVPALGQPPADHCPKCAAPWFAL